MFAPAGFHEGSSLLAAMADLSVFTALIGNWEEVGHHTLLRLRAESARAGWIAELDAASAALAADPRIAGFQAKGPARAVVPTIYRMGGARLTLLST